MPKAKKKRTTIEDLALMTARGFEQTAAKEDLKVLATKEELLATKEEMQRGFRSVNARLDLIRQDISDLPVLREKIEELTERVGRLEAKAGFKRA